MKYLGDDQSNVIVKDIIERIEVSLGKHKSNGIALIGHNDCAGNPISEK